MKDREKAHFTILKCPPQTVRLVFSKDFLSAVICPQCERLRADCCCHGAIWCSKSTLIIHCFPFHCIYLAKVVFKTTRPCTFPFCDPRPSCSWSFFCVVKNVSFHGTEWKIHICFIVLLPQSQSRHANDQISHTQSIAAHLNSSGNKWKIFLLWLQLFLYTFWIFFF